MSRKPETHAQETCRLLNEPSHELVRQRSADERRRATVAAAATVAATVRTDAAAGELAEVRRQLMELELGGGGGARVISNWHFKKKKPLNMIGNLV